MNTIYCSTMLSEIILVYEATSFYAELVQASTWFFFFELTSFVFTHLPPGQCYLLLLPSILNSSTNSSLFSFKKPVVLVSYAA